MLIEDRREVFEILARAAPTSAEGLDAALARCLRDDGKFIPTLALFAGEMELPSTSSRRCAPRSPRCRRWSGPTRR